MACYLNLVLIGKPKNENDTQLKKSKKLNKQKAVQKTQSTSKSSTKMMAIKRHAKNC